jgi:hypothetical protein
MESENNELHAMTINGPKLIQEHKIFTPYEHLTSDLSSVIEGKIKVLFIDKSKEKADLRIELKKLSLIQKYPYVSLQN